MDKTKSVMKSGWHPKGKDGGKESWRADFKPINQVASKFGRGKSSSSTASSEEHVSRPLTSLKDPAAFGPPPKNVNYHGGAAVPNSTTPDRRGLGAPLTEEELPASQDDEQQIQKPPPPPIPYRADRTGLQTQGLPPPPTRASNATLSPSQTPNSRPKPNLPPRLPPRQNTQPLETPTPPPPYTETAPSPQNAFLNQNAASRLGRSGISVPGFGIKPTSPPPNQPPSSPQPSSTPVSGLQSRFGSLSTSSPPASSPSTTKSTTPSTDPNPWATNDSAGTGTTWAQKQSALSTAGKFRNDPSSISLSEARSAAGTANNFRERHGAQVAQGWNKGQELNQKYDVAGRAQSSRVLGKNYTGDGRTDAHSPAVGAAITGPAATRPAEVNPWAEETSPARGGTQGSEGALGGDRAGGMGGFANQAAGLVGQIGKKAPPPPPPTSRKPTGPDEEGAKSPPPVPLGSKPR